ncbi:MAG TPA: DUF2232 domain-containing protein [Firmicutes bacterium]|nr:DUF2232 domain-containing protein [Bacillota bacterium]
MKTRSLVNAAMMIAIYFVFFILYFIGIFPELLSFALPLPFIIFHLTHKKVSDLVWMFVGCLVGTYLIGSVFGLFTTLLYGLVGVVLAIGMCEGWPYWNRILNAALIFVIVLPLSTKVLTGMNMSDMLIEMIQESIAIANGLVESLGQENVSSAVDLYNELSESIPSIISMLMPTLLIFVGGVSAFISEKLGTVVLKRMNIAEIKSEPLSEFQLGTMPVVVLFICNLLAMFISNESLQVVFINVMVLLNLLFLIQGFVLIYSFFKARSQKGLAIVIMVFALLSNLSLIVSMLGMMDAVFNYRSRFALKSS